MAKARSNGIELEWESFGDPKHPPLMLVMGFSLQMVAWDDEFCRMLAERGFRVIRFDNRDVGLSSKITGGPSPNVMAAFGGDFASASYSLEDMADDTAGLIDALELGSVHLVGVSMGGMIAQLTALRHPGKVRSLASMMSTTGDPGVGTPSPAALMALMRPPPQSREQAIDYSLFVSSVIGSPGHPRDEDRIRVRTARAWERDHDSLGAQRQLVAIRAAQPRTGALARIQVPTLVLHGDSDPLIHLSGGQATAKAIPGAELVVVPGMGHDHPSAVWPIIVDAIVRNAKRAEARAA